MEDLGNANQLKIHYNSGKSHDLCNLELLIKSLDTINSLLCYMAIEIWDNISSGNDLLPDGTKPLPESMLTNYQWGLVVIIENAKHIYHWYEFENYWFKITAASPRVQWVTCDTMCIIDIEMEALCN